MRRYENNLIDKFVGVIAMVVLLPELGLGLISMGVERDDILRIFVTAFVLGLYGLSLYRGVLVLIGLFSISIIAASSIGIAMYLQFDLVLVMPFGIYGIFRCFGLIQPQGL